MNENNSKHMHTACMGKVNVQMFWKYGGKDIPLICILNWIMK